MTQEEYEIETSPNKPTLHALISAMKYVESLEQRIETLEGLNLSYRETIANQDRRIIRLEETK